MTVNFRVSESDILIVKSAILASRPSRWLLLNKTLV